MSQPLSHSTVKLVGRGRRRRGRLKCQSDTIVYKNKYIAFCDNSA